MAMSLAKPSKKGSRRRRSELNAEINVTPMVDVMLVLLVIFMVTAPLLTVGVPVDLPQTKASVINEKEEPLNVIVDAKGTVLLNEKSIELEALVPQLVAMTGANPEMRIYVRGDKTINYGRVMEVMGAISAAGFKKVALITELPSTPQVQKRK